MNKITSIERRDEEERITYLFDSFGNMQTYYSRYSDKDEFSWAAYEAETIIQKDRIEADGGIVVDLTWINSVIRELKEQNIYSSCKLLTDANFGVKKDITGAVSKLYDLSGNNNDAIQPTGASQPIWSLVNGKGIINYDGTDDFLIVLTSSMNLRLSQTWFASGKSSNISCAIVAKDDIVNQRQMSWENGGRDDYLFIPAATGVNAGIALTANVPCILSFRFTSGVKIEGWKNNVTGTPVSTAGITTNDAAIDYSIGARYTGSAWNNPWNGYLNNTLAFDIALSEGQRQNVESIINSYYTIY